MITKFRKTMKARIIATAGLFCIAMLLMDTAQAQVRVKRTHTKVVVVRRPVHKVTVRRAHIRYVGMPRWGTSVTVLPQSHVTISFGVNRYYYTNGIYYAPRNKSYVVVRPVRGVRVTVLPVGYRTIVVGPRNYYYYYGTYYVKAAQTNNYIVVNPPTGAIVDALPEGYDIKTIDGNEYYYLDGVYYAEVDAPEFEDKIGYQVVEL
jgi:hypothetical protein